MDYKKSTIALSCDNHKLAALFFELVHPIVTWEGRDLQNDFGELPQDYPWRIFEEWEEQYGERQVSFLTKLCVDCGFVTRVPKNSTILYIYASALRLRIEMKKKGILAVPVTNSFSFEELYEKETCPDSAHDLLELSVTGLNLIDTDNADWEQIFEFRKDKEAKKKLRNFKLFLYDAYIGQSRDYIYDDILKKIDAYEEACKKHGFELYVGTLGTLLDSKSAIGAMSLAIAGILVGNASITNAALLSGASIEMGKLALNFAKKKRKVESFKNNHELAYIFEARKRLTKKK